MLRVLPILLGLGLAVYALIDCVRTPDDEVKGLPKPLWVVLIVLVTFVGPIAWLLAGRERRGRGPVRPSRPVAPDDDPEFLRRLEEQKRRRQREEKERQERERQNEDGDAAAGA